MTAPVPELSASVELEVPYHDCDPAGVVWHGNYLRYFDEARCRLLDKINYGYIEMEANGHVWPVIDAKLRYAGSVRFHDRITVTATLEEYEYRLRLSYKVFNQAGELVTKGMTVQVAVDLESGEMLLGSPQILLDRLGVPAA